MTDSSAPSREVHITDMQTFNQCRRQWDWSSLLRRGLQPAILPEPLFMGQAIHVSLDHGYRASVGGPDMTFDEEAALAAFDAWVADQQNKIDAYSGPLWVKEAERIQDNLTMGRAMLIHYTRWAHKRDQQYQLLGTEKQFRVPLPPMPPADDEPFGPLDEPALQTARPELWYAGRFDGLIRDKNNGLLYILEFKTSKYISITRMAGVFRSMQGRAYIWAARQVYDAPVVGVVYRILRKKMPDIPTLTKRGTFSYNKSQKMTPEWLDYCLDIMAVHQAKNSDGGLPASQARVALDIAAVDLRRMIDLKTANEFFLQKVGFRSEDNIAVTPHILRVYGEQMVDPDVLVPPFPGYHCSWCKFQEACDLMEIGDKDSAEAILEAEFAPRDYWESVPPPSTTPAAKGATTDAT